MSKLILMRFLVQLCTLEEIQVLWQDHVKLCINITCPDQCIALNWNILIKGVPAQWGSSLTTRLSHVLVGRAFQSHFAMYYTQMQPENKMFPDCFWWGCPLPGDRRCGFDFSPHFFPKRPLPFSMWIFNYWAMRNKEDTSQEGQSIWLLLCASFSEDPSGLDSEVRQAGVRSPLQEEQACWQLQGVGGCCTPPHYKNFSAKGTSIKQCTWRAKVQWVFQSLGVPRVGLKDQINTFYGFRPMCASLFHFLDLHFVPIYSQVAKVNTTQLF